MTPRIEKILKETSRIFGKDTFRPSRRKRILADMPDIEEYNSERKKVVKMLNGDTGSLSPAYQEPLLSHKQEIHQFRKYNYLKSLARKAALKGHTLSAEKYMAMARKVQEQIALANMRLGISMCKRVFAGAVDHETVLQEAYCAVFHAVSMFDWRRRVNKKFQTSNAHYVKFSTYAGWAVRRRLWQFVERATKDQQKIDDAFIVSSEVDLETFPTTASAEHEDLARYRDQRKLAKQILGFIKDPRDQLIIKKRFGIDCEQQTCLAIGHELGVTKERIRQIETRALRIARETVYARGIVYEEAL